MKNTNYKDSYNEFDILQGQADYALEEWENCGFESRPTEEEAWAYANDDYDLFSIAWEDLSQSD